jgi:Tfp pilus assembly protein FimT
MNSTDTSVESAPHHHKIATRGGFSAVELLVVIGVMMLLMGMAAPGVLKAIRRGTVNSAANDLTQCWRQARLLALSRTMPDAASDGGKAKHYGMMVVQRDARLYAAVIYDNRDEAAIGASPENSILRRDPTSATTSDSANPPVAKFDFNRNVLLTAAKTASSDPTGGDRILVVYAQYRTGLPISAADVRCGHGSTATAVGMGLSGNATTGLPDSPICAKLRLQTMDYVSAPDQKHGYAVGITLFPIGVVASQEL